MPEIKINLNPPRGTMRVTPSWTMSIMERAKRIPGRSRLLDKVLHFELTPVNIEFMRGAFPEAVVSGGVAPEEDFEQSVLIAGRPPFATALPMTELQVEAHKHSLGQKVFGFFEKPGSGKTKIILDAAIRAWCEGTIDGMFVLSYSIVNEQWVLDELPKHIHPSIPFSAHFWKTGKKLDPKVLESDPTTFRVFTMNYEAYSRSKKAKRIAQQFSSSGRMLGVLDESHRIKTPDSETSMAIVGDRGLWARRYIASGEPTPLGLQDYYAQFYFLEPAILDTWTFTGFKSQFCRMGGFDGRQIIDYVNQEEMHRRMAPYVHVGAPKISHQQIFEASRFTLGPQARAAYDAMERELLVELESGAVSSVRFLMPKLIRLAEIACGRLTDNDKVVHEFEDNRMELLKSLVDIHEGQKLVIWSRSIFDHDKQFEHYGPNRSAILNGSTPKKDRGEIIKAWMDPNSGLDLLIASAKVGGTGLNLQGLCRTNIYYSNSDNAGERWQSQYRTYRIGVNSDIMYYDIIARNTVDVGIRNRHRRKRELSDLSIAEFRELIKERTVEDWEPK